MKRWSLLSALVLILAAGSSFAMKGSGDVVHATAATAALSAVAGERVNFVVDVDIAKKWHLYAHEDSTFIGIDLVPAEDFPLAEMKAEFPHGHEGEFFGEKVKMIEGKVAIEASALVPVGLPAGVHMLNMTVTAQACDDKTCLPPADLPVSFKLTVQ